MRIRTFPLLVHSANVSVMPTGPDARLDTEAVAGETIDLILVLVRLVA